MTKKIGVMTSGGDCPGLNAAIRAIYLAAKEKGYDVWGIEEATTGLLEQRVFPLTDENFNDGILLRLGGSFLGSLNRGVKEQISAFHMPDGTVKNREEEFKASLKKFNFDCIIAIGGDGSLGILHDLSKKFGFNFLGIPKTIDNDVSNTDHCIGFESAVNLATKAMDDLLATAKSHKRVQVLEVMGRSAGNIAIYTGIAGGADVILIPEIPYDIDVVVNRVKSLWEKGREYALIVVSEAITDKNGKGEEREIICDGTMVIKSGVGNYIAQMIEAKTGYEARATVLGALQRGCPPQAQDKLIAAVFGATAIDLIEQGVYNKMLALQGRKIVPVDIEKVVSEYGSVKLDGLKVRTARALGICLGDK